MKLDDLLRAGEVAGMMPGLWSSGEGGGAVGGPLPRFADLFRQIGGEVEVEGGKTDGQGVGMGDEETVLLVGRAQLGGVGEAPATGGDGWVDGQQVGENLGCSSMYDEPFDGGCGEACSCTADCGCRGGVGEADAEGEEDVPEVIDMHESQVPTRRAHRTGV